MTFSAPARIDLAGGTLDVPPLCYIIENSLTVNLAVNLRARVELKPGSGKLKVANKPDSEIADSPLFEKTFSYFNIKGMDAIVSSEIPLASGLGGSSSLLVALVRAAQSTEGERFNAERLLGDVTVLEHRLLGKPAGTQDAIGAIYGGLSKISFATGAPHRSAMDLPEFLSGQLYLAYSPIQHHSGINNWSVIKAACEGSPHILKTLNLLNQNSHAMHDALNNQDGSQFIESLFREVGLRRQLCETIATPDMAKFANHFKDRLASKVCGAGGGGCMFIFGKDIDPEELEHTAHKTGLSIIKVNADNGCTKD